MHHSVSPPANRAFNDASEIRMPLPNQWEQRTILYSMHTIIHFLIRYSNANQMSNARLAFVWCIVNDIDIYMMAFCISQSKMNENPQRMHWTWPRARCTRLSNYISIFCLPRPRSRKIVVFFHAFVDPTCRRLINTLSHHTLIQNLNSFQWSVDRK